jgi:hypothetical protein
VKLDKEKEIDASYYGICLFILNLKKVGESRADITSMLNQLIEDLYIEFK